MDVFFHWMLSILLRKGALANVEGDTTCETGVVLSGSYPGKCDPFSNLEVCPGCSVLLRDYFSLFWTIWVHSACRV